MEVGEYARTRGGYFGIIESINNDYINLRLNNDLRLCISKEKILIHNKDLFYVLLSGDYINGIEGGRIKAKVSDNIGNYFLVGHNGMFFPNEIKSVITAEQYKKLQELKQNKKELNSTQKELELKGKEIKEKLKKIKEEKAKLKQETKEFEENSIFTLREEK